MFEGRLKDKVIIVTGGKGLIGKHIVVQCKAQGAIVIDVDVDADTNLDAGTMRYDVTSTEQMKELIETVIQRFGRIDGLVNNAYPRTPDWGTHLEDIPYESWQRNVDMQLNSTFYLCQIALKKMKAQGSGAIVNMGSIYGVVGNDFTLYEEYGGTSPAAYSAIKGGIINFTRYLAAYYGSDNIRVNCVSPGGIIDHQHPSFIERYENKVPMKRMGKPHEIAPAVVFLLSDEASYITGHNLMVDGRWTAI